MPMVSREQRHERGEPVRAARPTRTTAAAIRERRDRQVEHAGPTEHRPREQCAGERRPHVSEVDDRLAAGALRAGLQLFRALDDAAVACDRVGLGHRQLDERRQLIAERVLLVL